jgi:hypothetical protein
MKETICSSLVWRVCEWSQKVLGDIPKVKVKFHSFSILALDGGEWLTSHSGCFTPMKEPWYPLNRRMGGPRSWTVQPVAWALYWHHCPGSPQDILWVSHLKKFGVLVLRVYRISLNLNTLKLTGHNGIHCYIRHLTLTISNKDEAATPKANEEIK